MIFACFQSFGTVPVHKEAVNRSCRQRETGSAATLSTQEVMLSGPEALFSFKSLRSFSTPSWDMTISGMDGNEASDGVGIDVGSSLLNMD